MDDHILEVRGIIRTNLMAYFTKLEGVSVEGDIVQGADWEIEIGEEQKFTMGSLKIPLVKVNFRMNDDLYKIMLKDFMAKFACMGG